MNKKEAEQLLEDVFHNPFNEKKFSGFIAEFLNSKIDTDKKPAIWASSTFKDYIVNSKCFGTYIDTNKKAIAIVTVELKKTKSVEKARTIQRNFIANYLNKSGLDAAIIAFYGDDGDDWRLSFVKLEYKNVNVGGKLKSETELTPVKRYSYLVGKHEANHTCKSQLSPILQDDNLDTTLEEIEKAFSVDKVTKEFFSKYKELFIQLKESLDQLQERDNRIKLEFNEKDIDTISFSKKLLGQIVFLYFLQKKGWLGVTKNENNEFKWGSGSKDFLRQLYNKKYVSYTNFFNDVLEPLFYEALAIDRRDNNDYYGKFNCVVPFLNGGLFEPINNYSWEKTDILIDNEIFKDVFDTFDRFNFTIKEDDPLDKEVAVDPEMLGKVFENLLDVTDRKSKGAFYTPREIVHYMCQQSLINYLDTNLLTENISKEDIEFFIINGEYTLAELIREQEEKKQNIYPSGIRRYPLPESIKKNYIKIDELLKNVKIADPAVGSGAFPVGMMTEIVKARSILTLFFSEHEQRKRTNYNIKRECIENSLYGVDIELSAVEIAKLRFWLSLIVDEDDIKNIKPLPNLDNKIMCGNSLLDSFEGIKLIDNDLFKDTKQERNILLINIRDKLNILYKEKGLIAIGKSNKDIKEIEREIKSLEKQKQEFANPKEKIEYYTISDALQRKTKESKKKFLEMQKLQKEYFNEPKRSKKNELKRQIDDIEWKFIEEKLTESNSKDALEKLTYIKKSKSKPFFIWELYFCDVFNRENPGFDIVIGNPPYVSYGLRGVSKIIKNDMDVLKNSYPNSAEYKISLYALFMDKSILISRNNGLQTLIVPDSFLLGRYFSKIRLNILNNNEIIYILLLPYSVFSATVGFSVIYLFQKKKEINKSHLIQSKFAKDNCIIQQNKFEEYCYEQNCFRTIPYNRFRLFFNKETFNIVKKIDVGEKLITHFGGYSGCIPKFGKDSLISENKLSEFILTDLKLNKIIFKDSNAKNCWKDVITSGGDFSRYSNLSNKKFIYINKNKNILQKIGKSGFDFSKYEPPKLFVRQTADCIISTIDLTGCYCFNNIHLIFPKDEIIDIKYLLAILNSKLMNFYYKKTTLEDGRIMAQIDLDVLEILPIKNILFIQQKPLIELVDKILNITKDEDYLENKSKQQKVKLLEAEIDQLVYKLYGLTPDVIKIVERGN